MLGQVRLLKICHFPVPFFLMHFFLYSRPLQYSVKISLVVLVRYFLDFHSIPPSIVSLSPLELNLTIPCLASVLNNGAAGYRHLYQLLSSQNASLAVKSNLQSVSPIARTYSPYLPFLSLTIVKYSKPVYFQVTACSQLYPFVPLTKLISKGH